MSGDIFEKTLGANRFLSERVWILSVNQLVAITMTCQFMTAVDDLSHKPRESLRNPPQCKERRCYRRVVKNLQYPLRIRFYPRLHRVPVTGIDVVRERRHVKVVFDIDRQRVNLRRQLHQHLPGPDAPDNHLDGLQHYIDIQN